MSQWCARFTCKNHPNDLEGPALWVSLILNPLHEANFAWMQFRLKSGNEGSSITEFSNKILTLRIEFLTLKWVYNAPIGPVLFSERFSANVQITKQIPNSSAIGQPII